MSDLMTQGERAQATLIAPANTAEQFGKVYFLPTPSGVKVEITIRELMGSEGWHTGVAMDGSWSMRQLYGRGLKRLPTLTAEVVDGYRQRGWIKEVRVDGKRFEAWEKAAHDDAIRSGHMRFSDNEVEPLVREFGQYMLNELESGDGVELIYWACGKAGDEVEQVSIVDEGNIETLSVRGPEVFGKSTHLAPAIRHFLAGASNQKRILLFVSDGRLDDLDAVIQLTTNLAREIEAGRRQMTKCVLIGVGTSIDKDQLETLDDLDTGTDVDIWDHKIAAEMRDVGEIIAELVDENKIIAPTATILNGEGEEVYRFYDGLPCRCAFELPAGTTSFTLAVDDFEISQALI